MTDSAHEATSLHSNIHV